MTARSRTIAYGSAALLVVIGVVCAVLTTGTVGQILTFLLIAFGLGGAVLLVFYEVGLSEDRERGGENERAGESQRARDRERERRIPGRDPRLKRARFRRRP